VRLYSGAGFLVKGKNRLSAAMSIRFTWHPTPNVVFEATTQAPPTFLDPGDAVSIDLGGVGRRPLSGHVTSSSHGRSIVMRGIVDSGMAGDRAANATSVRFLIPNTPQMLGDWISSGKSSWAGRVELTDGQWSVRLDARPNVTKTVPVLRASGGYAVTHVGLLTKADGSEFSYDEADGVLDALTLFLSFARGFLTPPLLPVGMSGDRRVWSEWQGRPVSPWRGSNSWFSPRHPADLTAAFPGFMKRWSDPQLSDTFKLATWWFLEANGPAYAESSIVLTQVALEMLSWAILVEEERIVSAKTFRNKKTWRAEN
jgi:hypothetical protein